MSNIGQGISCEISVINWVVSKWGISIQISAVNQAVSKWGIRCQISVVNRAVSKRGINCQISVVMPSGSQQPNCLVFLPLSHLNMARIPKSGSTNMNFLIGHLAKLVRLTTVSWTWIELSTTELELFVQNNFTNHSVGAPWPGLGYGLEASQLLWETRRVCGLPRPALTDRWGVRRLQ